MSEETVLKFLQDLDKNKAAGLDNLSGKSSKNGTTVLTKTISEICNLSIKYSIFLSYCKIAKLKPLFEKVSKPAPRNDRHISLLSLISEIIEKVSKDFSIRQSPASFLYFIQKVFYDKTQSFLGKYDIIYRYQSVMSSSFHVLVKILLLKTSFIRMKHQLIFIK